MGAYADHSMALGSKSCGFGNWIPVSGLA